METEAQKKARLKREAEAKKRPAPTSGTRDTPEFSPSVNSTSVDSALQYFDTFSVTTSSYDSSLGCDSSSTYDSSSSSGFSDAGAGFS